MPSGGLDVELRGHNGVLITRDRRGNLVRTPLRISRVSVDLDMLISDAQLHGRVSHRPIRVRERFSEFSAQWAVRETHKYERLVRRLMEHWDFNLEDHPVPMALHYFNERTVRRGNIEAAPRRVAFDQVLLEFTFRMRLFQQAEPQSMVSGSLAPFVPTLPTRSKIKSFGPQWYTAKQLENLFTDPVTQPDSTSSGGN